MRIMVMFDLPMATSSERSAYARFRKNLIKDGYIMMQESIYCKLVMSPLAGELAKQRVKSFIPEKGVIQTMIITEKQYADIEYILGEVESSKLNNTDRLVIF